MGESFQEISCQLVVVWTADIASYPKVLSKVLLYGCQAYLLVEDFQVLSWFFLLLQGVAGFSAPGCCPWVLFGSLEFIVRVGFVVYEANYFVKKSLNPL